MATKKNKLPETWEEYCEQTGRDPLLLPDVSVYEEEDKEQAIANFKLNLLIPYCNGKKLSINEPHYEIWWDLVEDDTRPTGLGLRCNYFDYWLTGTFCGPRFAYVSPIVGKHMVKYFMDLLLAMFS